ncbi:MAG: hypothetical protein OSB69_17385 [Alphaproteobacteria bacterium]|nr:hypothetical protein [Alphaproteobacteria bacterium]
MLEENVQPAGLTLPTRPMLEATLTKQEMRLELTLEDDDDRVALQADSRALYKVLTN